MYVIKNMLVHTQTLCQWQKVPIILPLLVNGKKCITTFYLTNFSANNLNLHQPFPKSTILPLDANKAHGYDGISVSMLKLRSQSKIRPLSIIFQNCLKSGSPR